MPLSTSLRKLLCCAPVRQEEEEAPARRPLPGPMEAAPEPAQAGSAQAGQPYRGYVESEVDRMFQEMIDELETLAGMKEIPSPGSPAQAEAQVRAESPAQAEARARADVPAIQPVQEPARQASHRAGTRRLGIPMPDRRPGTQRLEIPLPDHPNPQHPPIYYRMDSESGRPIPERSSYISGDYVRWQDHNTVFCFIDILPWPLRRWPVETDFRRITCGWIYYTLEVNNGEISILLHDIPFFPRLSRILRIPLNICLFSPEPPDIGEFSEG